MDCKKAEKLIFKQADGELESPLSEELSRHIGVCKNCAQESSELRKLKNLFDHAQKTPAPVSLLPKVMAGIRKPEAPGLHVNLKSALQAAAFAVSVLFSVLAGNQLGSSVYSAYFNGQSEEAVLADNIDIGGYNDLSEEIYGNLSGEVANG